jgi:ABC-2 type transport system ATP-binding protein
VASPPRAVSSLRGEGRTVFVNSHLLSELEMISDRVAIMVLGQVVRQGTIGELAAKRQWYEIELAGDGMEIVASTLGLDAEGKGKLTDGTWVEWARELKVLRVGSADAQLIQPLLDVLRQKQCVVTRLELVRPSLESLFMEAVNGQEVWA